MAEALGEAVNAAEAAPPRQRAVAWPALWAVIAWGLSFPAIRVALEGLHPLALVAARLLSGAALLYVLLALRGGAVLPEPRERAACALLGLLLALHLAIQSYAMRHTTSVRAGWIVASIPVFIALGARVFLREPLGRGAWGGIAVALGGLALLQSRAPADVAGVRAGDVMMLLSCFTWTAYTLVGPRLARASGVLRVTALTMASAGAASTLLALAVARSPGPLAWRPAAAAAFLGLACSGAAFAARARAVHEEGAARSAAMLYLQPFITLAAGVAVGDPVTWSSLVGGPVVLLGVLWIQRAARPAAPGVAIPPARGESG